MIVETHTSADALPLPHLGVLAVRGADARRFLNGQLSQETLSLDGKAVRLAGLHNPQGRVLAVLRLVAWADDAVLCVLPRAAIAEVRTLLARYLLRAKAVLQDESAAWRLEGLAAGHPQSVDLAGLPVGAAARSDGGIIWRHAADGRCLRLTPLAAGEPKTPAIEPGAEPCDAWRLADIAAGLPEIHPETRGMFVAQMLNLDALDGISFTKGCYTGQEVIARAHYRGRVKRRLQRFAAAFPQEAAVPAAGATLRLGDGRAAQVVDAALRPDGKTEFLAVTPLASADSGGEPDTPTAPADRSAERSPDARVDAEQLSLPYNLPV